MPVPVKPHDITAYPSEDVMNGSVIAGHRDGTGVALSGLMVPHKSDSMYDDYGLETKRGWLFIGDPEAASAFIEGGRVSWGTRRFAVLGGPQLFEGFGDADNVTVPLEELVLPAAATSETPGVWPSTWQSTF